MDYQLNEILVRPDDLLLDPNNPRLKKSAGLALEIPEAQISSSELQTRLARAMSQKEHEVQRLVDSIRTHGFVNIDSIFVRRINGANKFLVIEGNRRTTAIKALLQNSGALSEHVKKSLLQIPVKELITPNKHTAESMTDFILSIRHIYGVKEWQPMQRAHSIYGAYVRCWQEASKVRGFRYVRDVAEFVAMSMNLKLPEVRKAITIYRIFVQMQTKRYPIKSDHYSLLEMLVSRPSMAKEFFGLDSASCELSDEGCERFYKLCVEEECPVSNPAHFRMIYKIYKDGTERELLAVLDGVYSLDHAKERVDRRLDARSTQDTLIKARRLLESIELEEVRGTSSELREAQRIKDILERKILPALN